MKTVVYQSYRTVNVPPWINRCMGTVRDWTVQNDFDYRFIDDRLFEYVPPWYRQRVGGDVLLVSDLARLLLAQEFLAQGYERTVWMDADLLIFDPDNFRIDVTQEYAFCREVWVDLLPEGVLECSTRVNNAVTVFVSQNSFLNFYVHAAQSIVRQKSRLGRLDIGTGFLTGLHELVTLPLLDAVGLISPVMAADLVRGKGNSFRAFMAHFGSPVHAANLCASFRGEWFYGIPLDDALYEAAVQILLQTRGEVLNRNRDRNRGQNRENRGHC